MIRIVDNKKVEMTPSEFQYYQEICKAYDRTNFQGKDLFKDLFEVDGDGILIMLKAPTSFTSMEIYMFLMALMQQQHLRIMHNNVAKMIEEGKQVIEETKKALAEFYDE